jgi:hypothetical protein
MEKGGNEWKRVEMNGKGWKWRKMGVFCLKIADFGGENIGGENWIYQKWCGSIGKNIHI